MAALKKDYSFEELGAKHNEIVMLYDYAEELAGTIESQFVSDPEGQAALIEPLINEVAEAADVLTEEFVFVADNKKHQAIPKFRTTRIESSLRKLYSAVADYQKRVATGARKTKDGISNIADPIVEKITRQIEKVVVLFVEFVALSLDRFMNKSEIDQLKQRQTNINFLLHQMSTQPGS